MTLLAGVLAAGATVRLLFAGIIPLFPDEAYYWEWSRRLAPGYFDHPPAIAMLIRAGTATFGTTPFGVRLGAVLAGLLAALCTACIARRLAGDDAALRAAIVITCLPLAAAGLVLATPDAPLLATTGLGLYAVVAALRAPARSRASLLWWTAAGLALGLAFASKYTSILLPVGVTIAVLSRRSLRERLREPGPYVACVVATLVFLPVLLWNAEHDWVSLGFQLRHGLGAPAPRPDPLAPLKRVGDMLGGQAGLVSPILFVLLALATVRSLRRTAPDVSFVLAVVAASSFLFFCYSATRQRVEANWPALAYIPAVPLLAAMDATSRARSWLRAGIWLGAVLSVVIYLHAGFGLLPLPPRKDPVARAAGWRELALRADSVARRASLGNDRRWLGADRYQDAAELAFYTPRHPVVFAMNLSGRGNQYDLWPRFPELARRGDDLVVAVDESPQMHSTVARLSGYFGEARRDRLVELRNRRGVVTQRRLWLLRGWLGGWPIPPAPSACERAARASC